jgi:hypothetical protein
VHFFMFDEEAHQICPDARRLRAMHQLESKTAFTARWLPGGFTPPSVVVRQGARINPADIYRVIGGPGRLKASYTASGNYNSCFTSEDELRELMDLPEWQAVNYVVQRDVGDADISINWLSKEDGVKPLFATRQLMDGVCHKGNLRDDTLFEVAQEASTGVADWAWDNGYRARPGCFFGIDFRIDSESGRLWAIECNARFTAPVYGWLLSMRLGTPWFGVVNLKGLQTDAINQVIPPELRFSPIKKCGVIMHNPGPLAAEGVCGVTLLAACEEQGLELLASLEAHNITTCAVA